MPSLGALSHINQGEEREEEERRRKACASCLCQLLSVPVYTTISIVELVLEMQLSILFPFSPAWVVPRSRDVFVIGFCGVAPIGFAQWCQSVTVLGVAGFPAWRSSSAGVAVCVRVSSSVASVLSSFPTGAGGSSHPSNHSPF